MCPRRLYTKLHLSRELEVKTGESCLLGISARNEGQNGPSADKNQEFGMHSITFAPHHSDSSAMLYVFEDNEAVIKMIFKGRSPTMRHVSRTHRVALDWLFDRLFDPNFNPLH